MGYLVADGSMRADGCGKNSGKDVGILRVLTSADATAAGDKLGREQENGRSGRLFLNLARQLPAFLEDFVDPRAVAGGNGILQFTVEFAGGVF